MSTFLLVGKGFSRLCDYLTEHHHVYITLLDERISAKHTSDYIFSCNFSSIDSIKSAAQQINQLHHIDGVIAIYENYILPAAHIAKTLGLPALPIKAAQACTDKELMRQKFAQATEKISPDFRQINNKEDLLDFVDKHSFPLVLKPANLSKSLLVTIANNKQELLLHYQQTMDKIESVYAQYAPHRKPKLLIEEFIEGHVYSVEAFVDHLGKVHVLETIVDYETGQELGYDDNFHYSRSLPSKLDKKNIAAIRHVAKIGCETLGIKNSPAHIEIILSPQGPRIVEIGARNGGYRERMHELANGIDITANTLLIALGKQPDIHVHRNDPCVVIELFPKQGGIFQKIANEESLKKLPSLNYYSLKSRPGQFASKSADGYKACAIIILHHKNKQIFEKDYLYLKNNVHVITINNAPK